MAGTVSGERFTVTYILSAEKAEALSAAEDICIEQTVEFPSELIKDTFIRDNIFGRIESFSGIENNKFRAEISFAVESSASELTQLLNVMLGNISLKPGIRISDFSLPPQFAARFKGSRFGISGLRDMLNVHHRPLISSAIKPMGMSTAEFADLAYRFALGGMDIIKDDHGLSDQEFSRYKDRVKACCAAVRKAETETGGKTLYFPNITAPFNQIIERAYYAKECGAGGVFIAPALTGFDAMRYLAEDDNFGLPVMSHPAFIGSYLSGTSGFTHGALLGRMMRLAGADIVVYPNFGGRFSFSEDECRDIINNCKCEFSHFNSIFPCPGGGMNFSNIPDMKSFYGNDVIYLMGGGLFKRSDDLVANCRELREIIL